MTVPFALKLAWRESRSSGRRLGVYMGSITLGVAALVAINSFRANVAASVEAEARTLLGADLRLRSAQPFPAPVDAVIDSVAAAGVPVSRVTSMPSMALAPSTGRARLVQLRALDGGYPFYGRVTTQPAELWPGFRAGRALLVDPAVLVQLGVEVGDTLVLGEARLPIAGTLDGIPPELGFQTAIGPRVYLPAHLLEQTGLVRHGSLVRYHAYFRLDGAGAADRLADRHRALLREHRVGFDTAREEADDLAESLGWLARYLGLVGLTALFLGGIGVASAVHVFIKEKLSTVAVLRCLGATQRSVFTAYLLQAGVLGLAGAAAGVGLGVAVQLALPALIAGVVPVDVGFAIDARSAVAGLVIGAWTANIFAWIPLQAVRDVAPLQALRTGFEPRRRAVDPWRVAGLAALAASVLLLCAWQAPRPRIGLAFAAGIAACTLILWLTAALLVRCTRRFFPARAGYVVRQGVANLFRPHNQTIAVTLVLGFGVFLLAALFLVQRSLVERFSFDAAADRPNLLLFDVQRDQIDGLRDLLDRRGAAGVIVTPIVPARIAALNGESVDELLARDGRDQPAGWALRREYRNTYRDTLVRTERLVAGEWWSGGDRGLPRISVEDDLARSLGIGVGGRITWDVQGVPIETEVASLRRVDWARFEPNFFVVFEPGVLEDAPQSLVTLARIPGAAGRAELQGDIVDAFPNVSALDLALVQQALDAIASRAALAVRLLALLTTLGGIVVLIGALNTSRYQRTREGALLRTLGASRRQVRRILATEYVVLGAIAGLAGVLLGALAAWAIVALLFEFRFHLAPAPLLAFWAGTALLTLLVGTLNGRDVLRRPPLAVLRDTGG